MKTILIPGLIIVALCGGVFEASSAPASDSKTTETSKSDPLTALQGKWKGKEIGGASDDACRLVITGKTLEFRGANPNEWYKGTFSLKEGTSPKQIVFEIAECSAAEYNGKTSQAIYKLENGILKVAGNAPGNPNAPASFDAEGARVFEFKAE
jgi:uncharacterized protein (TIGR03067 family)